MPNQTVMAWIRARVDDDAPMRKAAEQHTAGPAEPARPGGSGGEGSPDVLSVLTREHNQVRTLIQQLTALPGHKTGGTAADLAQRRSLADAITARLSRHEAAEGKLFWPAVRAVLPDGDKCADSAGAQENGIGKTLTALAGLEPDSDEFDSLVARLTTQVRKHVADEAQVFLRMREAMPENDRENLGQRLLAAEKEGTARPGERAPRKDPAQQKARKASGPQTPA